MQTSAEAGNDKAAKEMELQGRMAYLKMKMLRNNLRQIEDYDLNMLKKFQKRLQEPNFDNYFGTRMEIQIAANLIQKAITFRQIPSSTKRESPDFAVKWEDTELYIECTNSHYPEYTSATQSLPPHRKIGCNIDIKAQKSYASMKTALFLDFTSVHSHSTNEDHLLQSLTSFSDYVKTVPGYNYLGSIILCTYIFDPVKEKYSSGFIREDNHGVASELKFFLDHFSGKGIVLMNCLVPFDV